ncbi:MAG: transcription antitermination factor NusB [bacterium]|jgi:N utilization substance protein B
MSRRLGREIALKVMFQVDVGKNDPTAALDLTLADYNLNENDRQFTTRLVSGTLTRLPEIDAVIKQYAIDWSLERIANIDRNLLRMAIYEIYYCDDIPVSVSINEAIELARKYSTAESGRFINGILGKLTKDNTVSLPGGVE